MPFRRKSTAPGLSIIQTLAGPDQSLPFSESPWVMRRHHLFLLPFQFSNPYQIFFSNQKPKLPNTSAVTSNSNVTIVRSNAAWLSQHSLLKPAGGVMPAASLLETVLGTLDQR